MPLKPVFLYTDYLIWILVAFLLFSFYKLRKNEAIVAPWKRLLTKRSAVVSLIVLSFYVMIGLADSIHFRLPLVSQTFEKQHYSTQVISVLDLIIGPMSWQKERSYSKPFAKKELMKKTVLQNNQAIRTSVDLKYVNPRASVVADIAMGLSWAIFFTLLLTGVCFLKSILVDKKKGITHKIKLSHWFYSNWLYFLVLFLVLSVLCILLELCRDYHVFGTDKVGQDVFFQTLKSIRTGLIIGTLTTLIMLPIALACGSAAGYYGGWFDDLVQYMYTTLGSIPGVLLIASSVLTIQVLMAKNPDFFATSLQRSDARLLALCCILGITSWTGLCRLLRAETLKIREMEYIQAANCLGVHSIRIIWKHILPNLGHIILIVLVLDFSSLVLAEAVLSYVGIGVDPASFSWGNMINQARMELAREPVVWWSLSASFIFMFILVLFANIFADALRDAYDPRLKD